jgi:hypothetical protein
VYTLFAPYSSSYPLSHHLPLPKTSICQLQIIPNCSLSRSLRAILGQQFFKAFWVLFELNVFESSTTVFLLSYPLIWSFLWFTLTSSLPSSIDNINF